MESRILMIVLVIMLLLTLFLVSGAGCGEEEVSAESLDSELSDLESMSQALNDLEFDMNESELDDLEGII
ncbi:MAG: hypothetical protein IB618_00935 [Candidatus Pacearchaeota archaeon]|nr:MAG: hypothetical protein IB618_00935 [Candidatus Pacearchaeota archaeon]